jgi:hypothetical protein
VVFDLAWAVPQVTAGPLDDAGRWLRATVQADVSAVL